MAPRAGWKVEQKKTNAAKEFPKKKKEKKVELQTKSDRLTVLTSLGQIETAQNSGETCQKPWKAN